MACRFATLPEQPPPPSSPACVQPLHPIRMLCTEVSRCAQLSVVLRQVGEPAAKLSVSACETVR
jgi:hypothetical protein